MTIGDEGSRERGGSSSQRKVCLKTKEKQANKTKPQRASTDIQEGNEDGEGPGGQRKEQSPKQRLGPLRIWSGEEATGASLGGEGGKKKLWKSSRRWMRNVAGRVPGHRWN